MKKITWVPISLVFIVSSGNFSPSDLWFIKLISSDFCWNLYLILFSVIKQNFTIIQLNMPTAWLTKENTKKYFIFSIFKRRLFIDPNGFFFFFKAISVYENLLSKKDMGKEKKPIVEKMCNLLLNPEIEILVLN